MVQRLEEEQQRIISTHHREILSGNGPAVKTIRRVINAGTIGEWFIFDAARSPVFSVDYFRKWRTDERFTQDDLKQFFRVQHSLSSPLKMTLQYALLEQMSLPPLPEKIEQFSEGVFKDASGEEGWHYLVFCVDSSLRIFCVLPFRLGYRETEISSKDYYLTHHIPTEDMVLAHQEIDIVNREKFLGAFERVVKKFNLMIEAHRDAVEYCEPEAVATGNGLA